MMTDDTPTGFALLGQPIAERIAIDGQPFEVLIGREAEQPGQGAIAIPCDSPLKVGVFVFVHLKPAAARDRRFNRYGYDDVPVNPKPYHSPSASTLRGFDRIEQGDPAGDRLLEQMMLQMDAHADEIYDRPALSDFIKRWNEM
jgi:hypothetical protein